MKKDGKERKIKRQVRDCKLKNAVENFHFFILIWLKQYYADRQTWAARLPYFLYGANIDLRFESVHENYFFDF